ncbi:MAG: hypothetical protein KGY60_09530 [Bacteroidales bacterium]|nr:hypothetical protein [Bacteroidales bacterium]
MATQMDSSKNGGIVFFRTTKLDRLASFYTDRVGCALWLDQGACKIFRHGNMLFGFCRADEADMQGVITFFYPSRKQVDSMYERFSSIAREEPKMNDRFNIYHFYAEDPEGRLIEFQYFDHPLNPY